LNICKAQSWNYFFPAYWISFPQRSFASSYATYYLTIKILIRPNYHNNNFIGLTDSFSEENCRDILNDLNRYTKKSSQMAISKPNTFVYEHERSFYHSLKPLKLEDFQDQWGLAMGNLEKTYLKSYLRQMSCTQARFWIPVSWIGDAAASCNPYFSGLKK
jgi:hypothetical protein